MKRTFTHWIAAVAALLTLTGPARADQFQTGHAWAVETVTAQKLNDTVNRAIALPGLIGEQTPYTGALASNDELLLRRNSGNVLVRVTVAQVQNPPGAVMDFAGSTVPAGWLLCDGSAVSRTTYAALFAAIGTTYGAGDGSTTFNLPDARGRVIAGRDTLVGGAFADRLTATGTGNPGVNAQALGATGGVDRWTLLLTQIPSHAHALNGATVTALNFSATTAATGGSARLTSMALSNGGNYSGNDNPTNITASSAAAGGGQAHPIVQPTLVLSKIIKF